MSAWVVIAIGLYLLGIVPMALLADESGLLRRPWALGFVWPLLGVVMVAGILAGAWEAFARGIKRGWHRDQTTR